MLPWGHLAVGYLCYALYCRLAVDRRPSGGPALALAFGTQFPDLIDKPLAHAATVLPGGRTLAHSLPLALLVIPIAYLAAARRNARPIAAAFGIGYLSHLFADVLYPLLRLDFAHAAFVLWPLVEPVEYDTTAGFLAYLRAHLLVREMSPTFAFELGLVAVALVVWRSDGYPGLGMLRSWSLRVARGVTGQRS